MKNEKISELKKLEKDSDKLNFDFLKGKLNFDSPLNIALKKLNTSMRELICRKDIKVTELNKDCSLVILKSHLCITELINSNITDKTENFVIKEIEYSFIHEIELDEKGAANITLDISKEMSMANNEKFTLCFSTIEDAMICKHFIEKEKQFYWQKFFEINIPLNEQDCYQAHFFITKINRKKNEDERVFVITDKFIFNIAYTSAQSSKSNSPDTIHDLIKIKTIKWGIAIQFFKFLLINQNELKKNNYVLTIEMDKDKGAECVQKAKYPHKKKKDCEFMFDNERNMDLFIFHVKRLYYKLNKSYIPTSKDKK